MSFYCDKQIRNFSVFLLFFSGLLLGMGIIFGIGQTGHMKALYLAHDEAVASSLLAQGVSKDVAAAALTNTEISEQGRNLLAAVSLGTQTPNGMMPFVYQFQQTAFYALGAGIILLCLILACGTLIFFRKRKQLYEQAGKVLTGYINGDYSCHLPQNEEGAVYQIFALAEQLATMLQSENEAEQRAKAFLKRTISDISHQLKTPLAALAMYQEIIENEPDNVETVKEFSVKTGAALKRMEQLIQTMLKITRLDTGNIVFGKSRCYAAELIAFSINELTTRAESEQKRILVEGNPEEQVICDPEWTGEAVGNIVKNALDHTPPGGIIRITWERAPEAFRIFISDNGSGIAPEDIHHIFKRFYRSRHSLDTRGVGLGLSLAKSIVEGQGGLILVQSEPDEGTTFTLSFLTES